MLFAYTSISSFHVKYGKAELIINLGSKIGFVRYMKMECTGMRHVSREVKKEWIQILKIWNNPERKVVEVVKKEERIDRMEVHMSNPSVFVIFNGKRLRCSAERQSLFINRELKTVWGLVSSSYFLVSIYNIVLLLIGSI